MQHTAFSAEHQLQVGTLGARRHQRLNGRAPCRGSQHTSTAHKKQT
jgi:hypothetical protein